MLLFWDLFCTSTLSFLCMVQIFWRSNCESLQDKSLNSIIITHLYHYYSTLLLLLTSIIITQLYHYYSTLSLLLNSIIITHLYHYYSPLSLLLNSIIITQLYHYYSTLSLLLNSIIIVYGTADCFWSVIQSNSMSWLPKNIGLFCKRDL